MKPVRFLSIFTLITGIAHASVTDIEIDTSDAVIIKSTLINGNIGICSGVLLNENQVLTAAHCLTDSVSYQIRFQDFYFRRGLESEVSTQAIHPQYNPSVSASKYDIGLLNLKKPMSPTPGYVFKKVCSGLQPSASVTQAGFGGRPSGNQKVTLSLPVAGLSPAKLSVKVWDEQSVSGDSGAAVYAVENGQACLYAIHSTFNGLDANIPERKVPFSFNTLILKTLNDLK